jgi:hypothetical protein
MNIHEAAVRLGINERELEVLKAQEAAGTLPGSYANLADYLGANLLMRQNEEWAKLVGNLKGLRNRLTTFKEIDQFHASLREFIDQNTSGFFGAIQTGGG